VSKGATDTQWLPVVGAAGLVVLTRDKRIRGRPLERKALLDHDPVFVGGGIRDRSLAAALVEEPHAGPYRPTRR
jgi:hypothetical protein